MSEKYSGRSGLEEKVREYWRRANKFYKNCLNVVHSDVPLGSSENDQKTKMCCIWHAEVNNAMSLALLDECWVHPASGL